MSTVFKVLMILTSQATMGDDPQATGVWLEEVSTPYYAFVDAGVQVDVASIAGGDVPIDPSSLKEKGKNPASVERFTQDAEAMKKIKWSTKIDAVSTAGYAAVYLPGGHGTMWDLPKSGQLAQLLSKAWAEGQVVSAVCHGPAGLVNVKDVNGQPLVAGRHVAGFSDSEEKAVGLATKVPFLLESRLRALGGTYKSGPNFKPFVVRDGRLITGQNPASSEDVARLVLQAIREPK